MNFHFGAEVRSPDGGKLGELRRVVYDPSTEQVTALVLIEVGLDGEELVAPIGSVQSADDEAVTLAISEEQLDDLDLFVQTRNIAPPPDAEEVTSDQVHDAVDVPDVLPVGAATGIESIAFTPVLEEIVHIPTGDQTLDQNTTVWATDGEAGHVAEVHVNDQTLQITALVVQHGLIFKHDAEVSFDLVENVRSEAIVLSVDTATIEAQSDG